MVWLCRTLLLISFSLFWGGLTFYTGVVVRISHDVLSDSVVGGLITQRVTEWLQLLGLVTAALMLWNTWQTRSWSKRLTSALLICSLLVTMSVVGLMVVHGHLDAVIDVESQEITDRDAFTIGHRRYNQLTTVEWLASLCYLLLSVRAWLGGSESPQPTGRHVRASDTHSS